jgi:hypothetical protein
VRQIAEEHVLRMTLDSLVELSDEENLYILQRFDQFRQWRSLDEKRYCLVCGEIITGREIRVIRETNGKEPQRVTCPTEGCDAIPWEWAQPTDDVLIKIAMVELECRHLRLITRAGRALRSSTQKKTGTGSAETKPEPPFG